LSSGVTFSVGVVLHAGLALFRQLADKTSLAGPVEALAGRPTGVDL
jgi:hypothetical protein